MWYEADFLCFLKKIESLTCCSTLLLIELVLFVRDNESIKYADQGLTNVSEELDKDETKTSESPKSGEFERSMRMKNLRIKIPLTNPARTFSAISYLLWDDLVNQLLKKCGPEGNKLHINKKKLHHAEKMIRGAFVELYKGLGYLKTYRYDLNILHISVTYLLLLLEIEICTFFRNWNMLAFVKILKKFDKVSTRGADLHFLTILFLFFLIIRS